MRPCIVCSSLLINIVNAMHSTPCFWYGNRRPLYYFLLIPLSWLFCMLVYIRYFLYRLGIFSSWQSQVPVIVIGNITVGGTGKTSLVIWVAKFLKKQGYKPGLVSRGYGGKASHWPQQVRPDSDYVVVGDEAVMLAARTECPMAVGPDRRKAIESLLQYHDIDVIISDDGLQHYALRRTIEIAVVDGDRRFGNGHCLPAGPLRENISRLDKVHIVVVNGEGERHEHPMQVHNEIAVNLVSGEVRPLSSFDRQKIHAVAGIGNPIRFFQSLVRKRLKIETHEFPDHHRYSREDVTYGASNVLMTEKDAVKCIRFKTTKHWCVPATVELGAAFGQRLLKLLQASRI